MFSGVFGNVYRWPSAGVDGRLSPLALVVPTGPST